MDDAATAPAVTAEAAPAASSDGVRGLLRRADFRRVYAAGVVSELGDAFQYIALMWVALVLGGPLGVMAVRLADSVPALVFGFHGGVVADSRDRRTTMVAADLVRAATLVPVAVLAVTGSLPLWALVVAAFAVTTATSYFEPAYGGLLPAVVSRENVQTANGLVQATNAAVSVGGWAVAAALLAFLPIGVFFALNAASFAGSALLLRRVGARGAPRDGESRPRVREGLAALRPRPALAVGVVALGLAITVTSGTWMVGVPTLVRDTLHGGAGSFSLVAAAYALGVTASGLALARVRVRRKAVAGLLAWVLYLPAYGLFAVAGSLGTALAAGALAGTAQTAALVLLVAAVQETIPDGLLGRVTGLVSLVHRGAHATGLLLVSPLFAVVAPRAVFGGAAVAIAVIGLAGATVARRSLP